MCPSERVAVESILSHPWLQVGNSRINSFQMFEAISNDQYFAGPAKSRALALTVPVLVAEHNASSVNIPGNSDEQILWNRCVEYFKILPLWTPVWIFLATLMTPMCWIFNQCEYFFEQRRNLMKHRCDFIKYPCILIITFQPVEFDRPLDPHWISSSVYRNDQHQYQFSHSKKFSCHKIT